MLECEEVDVDDVGVATTEVRGDIAVAILVGSEDGEEDDEVRRRFTAEEAVKAPDFRHVVGPRLGWSLLEVEEFHEGGEGCQRARRGLDGFDLCPHFESAMRVGAIVEEGAKEFRWKGIDKLLSDEMAEVCILDSGDAEVSDASEL